MANADLTGPSAALGRYHGDRLQVISKLAASLDGADFSSDLAPRTAFP